MAAKRHGDPSAYRFAGTDPAVVDTKARTYSDPGANATGAHRWLLDGDPPADPPTNPGPFHDTDAHPTTGADLGSLSTHRNAAAHGHPGADLAAVHLGPLGAHGDAGADLGPIAPDCPGSPGADPAAGPTANGNPGPDSARVHRAADAHLGSLSAHHIPLDITNLSSHPTAGADLGSHERPGADSTRIYYCDALSALGAHRDDVVNLSARSTRVHRDDVANLGALNTHGHSTAYGHPGAHRLPLVDTTTDSARVDRDDVADLSAHEHPDADLGSHEHPGADSARVDRDDATDLAAQLTIDSHTHADCERRRCSAAHRASGHASDGDGD